MTARAALSPPDRRLTAVLADVARAAVPTGAVRTALGTARRGGATELSALADDPAPRLLRLGAALARRGLAAEVAAPLLAGTAAGLAAARTEVDLDRGLAAAEAVTRALAGLVGDDPVAYPTLAVPAAAVCACLTAGDDQHLETVIDLAASLMVITPAPWAEPAGESELLGGHAALAGWLAWQLPAAGFSALPGAVAHTLSAVAGLAPDAPVAPPSSARPAAAVEANAALPLRDLLRMDGSWV